MAHNLGSSRHEIGRFRLAFGKATRTGCILGFVERCNAQSCKSQCLLATAIITRELAGIPRGCLRRVAHRVRDSGP